MATRDNLKIKALIFYSILHMRVVYTSNDVWKEILIVQAVIASHHRTDEQIAATGSVAIGIFAIYVPFMRKLWKTTVSNHLGVWFLDSMKTKRIRILSCNALYTKKICRVLFTGR